LRNVHPLTQVVVGLLFVERNVHPLTQVVVGLLFVA